MSCQATRFLCFFPSFHRAAAVSWQMVLDSMSTFFILLLAHLLADFPLQTNRIFRLKVTSNAGLALHVLIHVAMAALLLRQPAQHLNLLLALGVAHLSPTG